MAMIDLNRDELEIIRKHRVLKALNAAEDCLRYVQGYKDSAIPNGICGTGERGAAIVDIQRARTIILGDV